MTLTFSPVYQNADNKERVFKIGKFRELNIYAAEIVDTTGVISDDEFLLGGKDVLLMGLTENEFMYKETNKSKLLALVDELVTKIPKDRLLSYKQLNFKDEIVKQEITPKCDSIDEGEYVEYTKSMAIHIPNDVSVVVNSDFYLAANYYARACAVAEDKQTDKIKEKIKQIKTIVIKKLKALNEFYYFYNKSMGERYPTIGPNDSVWIFTMEKLAQDIIAKNEGTDLAYKKVSAKEFSVVLNHMYRYGMTNITFNPGYDFMFTIKRDEFMPIVGYEDKKLTNSELHYNLIRFLQNKAINLENCQKAATTLWNIINKQFKETVFLVPMLFEDDLNKKLEEKDMKLHYTEKASEIAKNMKIHFYDMSKFDTTPVCETKNMTYITLKSKNKEENELSWFPVFTDIFELRMVVGESTRVGVMSFEDIIAYSLEKTDGLCINPLGINLRLETNKQQKDSFEEKSDVTTSQQEEVTNKKENTDDLLEKKSVFKKLFKKE